jgi:hypothetical protein
MVVVGARDVVVTVVVVDETVVVGATDEEDEAGDAIVDPVGSTAEHPFSNRIRQPPTNSWCIGTHLRLHHFMRRQRIQVNGFT